jgi:hypothetical protein
MAFTNAASVAAAAKSISHYSEDCHDGWHALRYSEGRDGLAQSTPFGVPQSVPPSVGRLCYEVISHKFLTPIV